MNTAQKIERLKKFIKDTPLQDELDDILLDMDKRITVLEEKQNG